MILYCWVVLADKVGRSNNNILPLCKRCRWFECFLTNISVFNEWNSGPFQVQVRVRIADRGIVQRSMWRVQSHPRAGCSSKRSSAHRENPWHRRSSIDREKKRTAERKRIKAIPAERNDRWFPLCTVESTIISLLLLPLLAHYFSLEINWLTCGQWRRPNGKPAIGSSVFFFVIAVAVVS